MEDLTNDYNPWADVDFKDNIPDFPYDFSEEDADTEGSADEGIEVGDDGADDIVTDTADDLANPAAGWKLMRLVILRSI